MIADRQLFLAKDILSGLCFTAQRANSTVRLDKVGSPDAISLVVLSVKDSVSDYTWSGNTGRTITLANVGDKVYFMAKTENQTISKDSSNYYKFVMTGKIAAGGSIQWLLRTRGLRDDAPSYCYFHMFDGCAALTTTPALPATTLAQSCYDCMFLGCSSLTTAPTLPAITLAPHCYANMFRGSRHLTTAPELPAITLAPYCYANMFRDCRHLTTAPELPATTLADHCYQYMFYDCTSLTKAPDLPIMTLANSCYSGMFSNCTALTTAPALPATTLAYGCYQSMFYGCSSLTTTPELPATSLAGNCYYYMFQNCTALTTAPALPATTLAGNCYYYMFNGCNKLAAIDVSFTAWNPSNATTYWVDGIAASGTFTCPAALPKTTGNSYIPSGWTIIEK